MRILSMTSFLLLLAGVEAINTKEAICADAIVGVYISPRRDRKIEIYKQDNGYFGRVVWVKRNGATAGVGTILLKDLKYTNGSWHGEVYLPVRKKTVTACISAPTPGSLIITETETVNAAKTWKRIG